MLVRRSKGTKLFYFYQIYTNKNQNRFLIINSFNPLFHFKCILYTKAVSCLSIKI